MVPFVIDDNGNGERNYDIYSRLLEDRIVFCSGEIDTEMANTIVAQLLYLEQKDPNKDICLYINSPGGVVTAGLAICDTMNFIKCDVSTVCIGLAASMGAFILANGAKGKRISLPNSEIMIHQPLGGAQGQATDVQIRADQIMKIKKLLNTMMANATGKTIKEIEKATDRDNYMSAEEALKFGLIDKIIKERE